MDAEGEERLIRGALANHLATGRVEIDILKKATIRNINKLREKPYNVFHFIGHGIFEGDKGYVALVDQDNMARLVDDETFSSFFLGNRSLGLVILNACQCAATSSHQAFAGMAPHLVRRGIPAVIAMQYAIAGRHSQAVHGRVLPQRLGVSAAALTLQCRDTVCPELSLDILYDKLVI